ncbi:hypothetical protein Hbl1158_14710 [Halobaculum sp. CBA1158]|uniref:hypothetical protein n=1 Tax=Halobaculum sp. CBA1158 TaxID=2904243 RepID=UPI001F3968DE|nr:hypothetical protein [Halobaculum sp. CBA1158]UIO99752.1 hypothetical protein Hbl1158_14710 [Halobaculum sp. CBA1158]
MRTVPIPGRILEDDVAFGLSFDEIILMASIPLVVMLPSLFIEQVPLLVSIGTAVVAGLVMVGIVVSTPEGQSPTSWAPAALRRRLGPDTYYLRPDEMGYDRSTYLSVRHSAATDGGEPIDEQPDPDGSER